MGYLFRVALTLSKTGEEDSCCLFLAGFHPTHRIGEVPAKAQPSPEPLLEPFKGGRVGHP